MEEKHGIGTEIIYHFDVEHHRIPLAQFIDTAEATRDILDNFNDQFFNGDLKYDLHVLPSEEGGYIEIIEIAILGGSTGGLSWTLFTNDIFKEIINRYTKGFLGQEFGDSVENLGKKHRKLLKRKNIENIQDVKTDETGLLSKKEQEELIAMSVIYFLREGIDKLADNNITPKNFFKAFKAKNKFYKACRDNPKLQGLSFDRLHDFPIKRSDFKKKIIEIPDEADEDTELQEFQYEIVEIVVSSPNWNHTGRGWQTQNLITFNIEDDRFWDYVDNERITPRVKDRMRVQWIYQDSKPKQKNVIVLKVLSYNGDDISEQLSEGEIQKELVNKNRIYKAEKDAKSLNNQPNLFPMANTPPNSKK